MTYSVTVKGQVTIPSQVRHALGIAPGDKVDFRLHGNEARLRPARDQTTSRGFSGFSNPAAAFRSPK